MTTEEQSKRPSYAKMKSWADHCSSDEESDDGMHHPARLTEPDASLDADLSYDESVEHISVTGEDGEDLDNLGGPGGYGGANNGGGGGGSRQQNNRQQPEEIPYPADIDADNLPPNFPTQAPYTAHIRNLCYKIESPTDLADKIEGLTRWRYQKKKSVTVTNARVGVDRATGKRKGFGYVEFDTAEELMIFLNLNDGFSTLNGRILSIDIAKNSRGPRNNSNRNNNHHNSHPTRSRSGGGGMSNIDGSQFRGGRYNRTNSNNSSMGGTEGDGGAPAPPVERRSLKLAPRTKPVEGSERSTSNSSIFGLAKPRDADNWRQRKQVEEEKTPAPEASKEREDNTTNGNAGTGVPSNDTSNPATIVATNGDRGDRNSFGRGSGRGRGRGENRRGRGRGSGRGRRDSNHRKNSDRRNQGGQNGKDSDGWDEAKGGPSAQSNVILPTVEKNETKKVTKVSNAFSVLGFDSDSE
mmetsp:Transcript_581/g.912  ORF Transcript_581/g.912 Transcript_581/m.912 type:complete len:467 (+) Transcript_581:157-1557(+)